MFNKKFYETNYYDLLSVNEDQIDNIKHQDMYLKISKFFQFKYITGKYKCIEYFLMFPPMNFRIIHKDTHGNQLYTCPSSGSLPTTSVTNSNRLMKIFPNFQAPPSSEQIPDQYFIDILSNLNDFIIQFESTNPGIDSFTELAFTVGFCFVSDRYLALNINLCSESDFQTQFFQHLTA